MAQGCHKTELFFVLFVFSHFACHHLGFTCCLQPVLVPDSLFVGRCAEYQSKEEFDHNELSAIVDIASANLTPEASSMLLRCLTVSQRS